MSLRLNCGCGCGCGCGTAAGRCACPIGVNCKAIAKCMSPSLPWILSEMVLAYSQQSDREKIIGWINNLPNATFAVPGSTPAHLVVVCVPDLVVIRPSWSGDKWDMGVLDLINAARHHGHIEDFAHCVCSDSKCYLDRLLCDFFAVAHYLSLALAHALNQW